MKHLLPLSLLILTSGTSSTMDKSYLLPEQQTIDKRLWDAGFSNFAKESKIGKKLEKQCPTPLTLWSALSNIRTQYLEKYPHIINMGS